MMFVNEIYGSMQSPCGPECHVYLEQTWCNDTVIHNFNHGQARALNVKSQISHMAASKLPLQRQFTNCWYVSNCFHLQKNHRIVFLSLFGISANGCCRGDPKANEKCPVGIADFVLLYTAAQEGLYGPSKSDRSAFDLFALCPGIKQGVLKFSLATHSHSNG